MEGIMSEMKFKLSWERDISDKRHVESIRRGKHIMEPFMKDSQEKIRLELQVCLEFHGKPIRHLQVGLSHQLTQVDTKRKPANLRDK